MQIQLNFHNAQCQAQLVLNPVFKLKAWFWSLSVQTDLKTRTALQLQTTVMDVDSNNDDDDDDKRNTNAATTGNYSFADIEAAAHAAAKVPLELSRYDARPRWCAVSLAHPSEFARFRDDARVKFYFPAVEDDDSKVAVMRSEDYCWWIEPEPKHQREARLRQIFGAYVCGDTLPWMEPFTAQAYADVDASPVRDMTAAINACLCEIVDDAIASIPAELREPEYVRLEREQAEARSKTRKRSGSD